ncbi:DUF4082 domain-containing protein [Micromonospora zhanjiangensis]|uniref:DUF4082 domain-containing protein n=1 Tax=Micromonospora zhanjiangensis TaxID=1522057 RepID=A0ABV8KME9_9ACTN
MGLFAVATTITAFAADARSLRSLAVSYSFFTNTDVSNVPTDPEVAPIEVGLRFTTSTAGSLTAVRFLKVTNDPGPHQVSVWSSGGTQLATAPSTNETSSGWQQVTLPRAVALKAGSQYLVSYHTTRYRSSENYFTQTIQAGPLSTASVNGLFAYGPAGTFPNQTFRATNYWVDLVFTPTGTPSPTVTPTTSPTRTPTAPPTTTSPTPTSTGGLNLPRVPWNGGPGYYAGFPVARAAGWTNPAFFPIGVWFEGTYAQADIDLDKAAGLNTYVQLTSGSNLPLIRSNGMYAVLDGALPGFGAETTGWLISDEVDMWAGPGTAAWTGNFPGQGTICSPSTGNCGYTVQNTLSAKLPSANGRFHYANYGKGVMFWESDAEAARFVNGWTGVVSNDIYWYTDPNVCTSPSEGPSIGVTVANCRRSANYGRTMDRMRALDATDGKLQAIWAFVEDGHPASENTAPTITGNQAAGAVMNSVIHEARGIIYFNHNFGGPCISQHVLRDCGKTTVRPKITETNSRIRDLAPVLNTQSYQWTFNSSLDTMLKASGGSYYIFAMPGPTGGTGSQKLVLPPGITGTSAQVLYENRSVPINGGAFTDTFAQEFTYHIYKITP